jgi:hypothetical protein
MSRRSAEQTEGVSLFPFLAVLLCTMGSLIVLLIVIARQARLPSEREQQSPVAKPPQVQGESLEMLAARTARLRTLQQTAADRLKGQRAELAHLEQHKRQIEDRLVETRAAIDERKRLNGANAEQVAAAAADLQKMQRSIREVESDVSKLRAESGKNKPSYSIVPYDGSQGTRRRPMYIECRQDEVILQPEGIVLATEDHFAVPGDPGNPLAAALRATEEHLQRSGVKEGRPYPLLLIRPDGSETYFLCRQALLSWNDDFGYELIEADWKLAFPPADPTLAQVQYRAVEEARRRQQALVASLERRLAKRQRFRAAPGGGVMREDGTLFSGTEPETSSGTNNTRSGSPGNGHRHGDHSNPQGRESIASGIAKPDAQSPHRREKAPVDPSADQKWIPPHERPGASGDKSDASVADSRPVERDTREGAGSVKVDKKEQENLTKSRGRDWGLRNPERTSIAVTRPISVVCWSDKLVIIPDDGPMRSVDFAPRTRDTIDDFVGEVWQQMRNWGTAGKGMHWRPTLSIRVESGGEQRFEDLCALLDGSGLDIKRRQVGRPNQPRMERAAAPAATTIR